MPLSKKVLEDSVRLTRIHRIKIMLYMLQVAILVALAFLVVFIIGDAKIKPSLYLPLDSFAAVVVLILFVICVEGFFFRILEIRFARSSSARHLMANTSMKRSILIAIISAAITFVLMVPPILSVVEDATERTVAITSGTDYSFWSRDPIALLRASEIRATSQDIVQLYLVKDAVYREYNGSLDEMYSMRLNHDNYVIDGELTITIPFADHTLFHLVLNDLDNPGAIITVTLSNEVSETLTGLVSLLTLAFVVANIAWVAYLVPIERKYAHGSIYK
ncbi:MAG: hypothetical protein KKE24_02825 [Candidatus Thermoplasmatota archaeon]|nr:hypothetical protein [Candidatus Thermoplasmatota archaeon]